MHFWLHSCGDNTLLLPDLISAGVDMFHPVQKHTMDEAAVAREFGGRIGFLAGNGIVAGTPLENVDAFLDEAMIYGTTHRNAAARVGGGRPERVARLDGLQ
jgi:uroporphyrinogen decarboxylase